jgi:hypothetical protein
MILSPDSRLREQNEPREGDVGIKVEKDFIVYVSNSYTLSWNHYFPIHHCLLQCVFFDFRSPLSGEAPLEVVTPRCSDRKTMAKTVRQRVKSFLRGNLLTFLTVIGVFGGVVLGVILRNSRDGEWTEREIMYVSYFGDIFLQMLKSLILPLIVSSIITAIGGLDLSLSGKIGARAIVYYFSTTVSAVILGMILVSIIHPGQGNASEIHKSGTSRNVTTVDTLLDLVRYVLSSF